MILRSPLWFLKWPNKDWNAILIQLKLKIKFLYFLIYFYKKFEKFVKFDKKIISVFDPPVTQKSKDQESIKSKQKKTSKTNNK